MQTLLRQAGYAQLNPKVKRDAIISYDIIHGVEVELETVNDKLFIESEKALF